MKIIYITPHLSTGGMPEYLMNQIKLLKDDNEIWVLELRFESAYRIQRDKIESMIGDNLIFVNKNYQRILDLIYDINPDIIHFCELSDYMIPSEILDKIYIHNRNWKIFETFHDSSIESLEKKYLPDKMLVVSPWQHKLMMELGVPVEIIQHEIIGGIRNRNSMLEFGLDPNKKHVIQVGLFSIRKNQSETFEMARLMPDVEFHFIGGLTDNYKNYWEPLLNNKPDNCIVWKERNDVDKFYEFVDAVIFPSRGDYGDRETNPLVIRESIAWDIPILVRNLSFYMDLYKESNYVKFMSDDIITNVEYLYKILNKNMEKDIIIDNKKNIEILNNDFFKKKLFNITFNSEDNKINFEYLEKINFYSVICVRDIDTEVNIYSFDVDFIQGSNYWCIPIPKQFYDFQNNPNFGGFLFDFYDKNNNIVYRQSLRIKRINFQKRRFNIKIKEPIFINYEQFFTDKIYDKFFEQMGELNLVIDVGANVGLFTELCLDKKCNNIISLEIDNRSIELFKIIHKNNVNTKLINLGLGKQKETRTLYTDENNSLVSSLLPNHYSNLNNHILVNLISLGDLIKMESIDEIDLIKIDVEGAEYEIFDGINDVDLQIINYILLEFHDNYGGILEEFILSKLREIGFEYEIFLGDCVGLGNDYEESGVIFAKRLN